MDTIGCCWHIVSKTYREMSIAFVAPNNVYLENLTASLQTMSLFENY